MRFAIVVALASGCIRGDTGFHCVTNADCAGGGQGGTCQLAVGGLCSFADSACASGQRFGVSSGGHANQCVDEVQLDAAIDTHDLDAAPVAPTYLGEAHTNGGAVATLTYPITIPTGSQRTYLLVAVEISGDCATMTTDTVNGITYDGVALGQVATLLGAGCAVPTGRSEVWGVVAPHEGMHDVVVELVATAPLAVHSAALAFAGVDQASPVRAHAELGGASILASIDVASQPNDLVVNTVGHGGGVSTSGQTVRYILNINTSYSMNNSAAATTIATGTTTTMNWTFADVDEWQTISTTLRP